MIFIHHDLSPIIYIHGISVYLHKKHQTLLGLTPRSNALTLHCPMALPAHVDRNGGRLCDRSGRAHALALAFALAFGVRGSCVEGSLGWGRGRDCGFNWRRRRGCGFSGRRRGRMNHAGCSWGWNSCLHGRRMSCCWRGRGSIRLNGRRWWWNF